MEARGVTAVRLWWLRAGLTSYAGFWLGVNRSTFYALSGITAGSLLLAEVFRRAGIIALNPAGSLANVAALLGLVQLVTLASTRLGWRHELFQDPPGPLLPYTKVTRTALWTIRSVAPIAIGLGAAYSGLGVALPALRGHAIVLAWLADVSALSAVALGLDLWRWLFRTYAPLALQRLWALAVIGLFNIFAFGLGVICLVVSLQFAAHRVFVSTSATAFVKRVAVIVATRPEAASVRAVTRDNGGLGDLEAMSNMSALVTAGRQPSRLTSVRAAAALLAVLVVVGWLPGGRPEELDRITRFAVVARERLTNVTVYLWPRRLRLAWRLILPSFYVAARFIAVGAIALTAAVLFQVWGDASPGTSHIQVERMLAVYGSLLATLLAVAKLAIINVFDMSPADYLRFAALPCSMQELQRHMLAVGAVGSALLDGLLAISWGLVVQRDETVAVCFALGIVLLLFGALCGFISLAATPQFWHHRSSGPSRLWAIAVAAVLIWQFQVLRKNPGRLPSITVIEGLLMVAMATTAWIAIGRMAARREPSAGLQ